MIKTDNNENDAVDCEEKMQAIELETRIDENGQIHLPKKYKNVYGKVARLLVLLPEQTNLNKKQRQAGSAKGILKILSEDTNHLDDFKDYM